MDLLVLATLTWRLLMIKTELLVDILTISPQHRVSQKDLELLVAYIDHIQGVSKKGKLHIMTRAIGLHL